jgi:hypothetical protein
MVVLILIFFFKWRFQNRKVTNLIFHNEGGKQTNMITLLCCNIFDVTVVSRRYVDSTMGRQSSKNARVCWLKGKMKFSIMLYNVNNNNIILFIST